MVNYVITTDNQILKRNLKMLIPHYGLEDTCAIYSSADNQTADDRYVIYVGDTPPTDLQITQHIKTPIRVGKIIDILKSKQKEELANQQYNIATYNLSSANNILTISEDNQIRLTDIEAQILIILAQTKTNSTSKETLLQKVWGYRPDLNTHTVETHIYRLRQKIEKDPASPTILLTTDQGYALSKQ